MPRTDSDLTDFEDFKDLPEALEIEARPLFAEPLDALVDVFESRAEARSERIHPGSQLAILAE